MPEHSIFFISALSIYEKHQCTYEITNVKANLAKTMFEMKRYDEAMKYLREVEQVFIKTKSNYGLSRVYNQLANYLVAQNKDEEALEYLDIAEQLAKDLDEKIGAVLQLQPPQKKSLKKSEDYKAAFKYLQKANNIQDSLLSERRHHEMSEIRLRYETQQLDSENEILKLKLNQQSLRTRYIIFALISTIFLFILFFHDYACQA